MSNVVELRPRAHQEMTSSLGMIVFLASWAMMFSTLFFAYAFLRSRAVAWPPPGVSPLPIALPAANTAVIALSSATLAVGVRGLAKGRRKALTGWVAATIALGGLFVGLQLLLWKDVRAEGVKLDTGVFGGIFYALTTLHALHVAAGLLVLGWIFVRSLRGRYTEHNLSGIRAAAMFWHFVDVVWVLMFVSLFLV